MKIWRKNPNNERLAVAALKVLVAMAMVTFAFFVLVTFSGLALSFSVNAPLRESDRPVVFEYDPSNPQIYLSREPADIAINSTNHVYVSLRNEPLVQYYSPTGSFIASFNPDIDASAANESSCYGLGISPSGIVYVTLPDVGSPSGRLAYFAEDGSPLGVCRISDPPGSHYCDPFGVAVNSDGSVYVTDLWNGRVQHLNPEGSLLGVWGSRGTGPGKFRGSNGVAVSHEGEVYVSDAVNDCIQYFTPSGSYLGTWGRKGKRQGEFDEPWDVAVGPGGVVFVCDSGNYRIQYFSGDGTFLGEWGKAGAGEGEFQQLNAVTVAPTGDVYVLDKDCVQHFTPDGSFLGVFLLHRSAYMATDARRFFSR
jgi:sugar lactone lactonase YvrE